MGSAVVLWSAASGLLLGLFIDALLIGAVLLLGAVVPAVHGLISSRAGTVIVAAVLLLVPVLSTALGFLEGRVKATT
jgi:hypothetical protein